MLEFLNLFWTTEGQRCIGRKTNIMQHFYFSTNEDADYFLETNKDKEGELYFSPALYKKGERNQSNVKSLQALWLDIDCGEGKDYATQQDGLDALASFIKSADFPPPFIISSGHGLHVYWVLQTPVAPDVWVGYAKKLKTLCAFEGLKADPARTADSASLLRPVGTYNRKGGEPTQVYFITKGKPVSLDAFMRLERMDDDIKTAKISAGTENEYPEAQIEGILNGCPLMADVAKKRGAVEEPLWRGMLSIVSRCSGGSKLIHELSKGDPRYNEADTIKKAELTKGPYTCDQLGSLCPDVCKNCPMRGKISSPIVLGIPTKVAVPPKEHAGEQASQRIVKTEHFDVTPNGVLKRPVLGEEDKTFYITLVPVWVKGVREKVCHADEQGNSSLQLEWLDLGKKYHCAMLPQADLYEKRNFTKWLAENNLRALVKGDILNLQKYVTEAIIEVMRMQAVEQYYETVGWIDDGFIVGNRCIKPSGIVPVSVQTSSSVSNLGKKGSATAWAEATKVLGDYKYWPHAFAVLCAFASPLLKLCNYQGAIVSMTGASGYGKTLAASFALSVYGEPSHLTQPASTTINAIGVQLASQKNLPYLLDEVSTEPGYKIADFIYMASNGRGKEALDNARNLKQSDGWCLIPFVTSNKSILEMPEANIQEAHRRRIIEIPFDDPISQDDATLLANTLQEDYGTAIDPFMEYVVANKERVQSQVESVLNSDLYKKIPPTNRFGKWTVACAQVAGEIAKKVGMIKFDVLPVVNRVLATLANNALAVKNDVEIAKSALCAFLYQNNGNINVWSSNKDAVDQTVVRSVIARFDPATDAFFMQKNTFAQVVRDAGVSLHNIEGWMRTVGIATRPERLGSALPVVTCYTFNKDAIGATVPEELPAE